MIIVGFGSSSRTEREREREEREREKYEIFQLAQLVKSLMVV